MSVAEREWDLVVVGAGAIGLACGWRAAQAGLDVCVLERDEPGHAASWVAAGILAPVTEAHFGEDALIELTLTSGRLWPGFAEELWRRAASPPATSGTARCTSRSIATSARSSGGCTASSGSRASTRSG
jgi:glycine/D-amino acid oxidase-like deaminating enzyme